MFVLSYFYIPGICFSWAELTPSRRLCARSCSPANGCLPAPRPPLRLPASGLCVALPLPGCGSPFPPQPQAVRASGRHPQKVLRPVPVPGGQLVLTLSYLSGLQLSFGFYVLCMNLCRYNIQYVLCIDLDEWFLSVSSPR